MVVGQPHFVPVVPVSLLKVPHFTLQSPVLDNRWHVPLLRDELLELERNSEVNWCIPPPNSQIRELRSREWVLPKPLWLPGGRIESSNLESRVTYMPHVNYFLNSSVFEELMISFNRSSKAVNTYKPANTYKPVNLLPTLLQHFLNCLFPQPSLPLLNCIFN